MTSRHLLVLLALASVPACTGQTLDAGYTHAPGVTRATVGAMIDAATMDDSYLYFTCEDGWVYRLLKAGTAPPEKIAPAPVMGSNYTSGIAVDATNVYWTAEGAGAGGAVLRAPKGGGAAVVIASGQTHPGGIAVDADNVYWAEGGSVVAGNPASNDDGMVGMYGDGTIRALSKSSGTVTALASVLTAPDAVTIDDVRVFWHDQYGIRSVAKTGGALSTVSGSVAPFKSTNLAVADGRLTWASNQGSWSIESAATAGGAPVTLASGIAAPAGIVTDGSSAYWSDAGGSSASALHGVPLAGGATSTLWPADDPGTAQDHEALLLLSDASAFYSIEYWASSTLTVEIRVLPR